MAKLKGSNSQLVGVPHQLATQAESDHPIAGLEAFDLLVGKPESCEESAARLAESLAKYKRSIPVLPYQERWITDNSPLKVAVWSRQSGKSFAAALRAVTKCLGKKRTNYIILSKGERQSRMFMEKVKDFCQVYKELKVLPGYTLAPETDEKTMEVYFPHNHSRIIGLPANADAARGYTGNIVLDEFAFHGDAYKIYAACFPIITRGYSIEVISTPNGTAGKFYEIAKQAGLTGLTMDDCRLKGLTMDDCRLPIEGRRIPKGNPQSSILNRQSIIGNRQSEDRQSTIDNRQSLWSGHRVDIYTAVGQRLPAKIELLRAGCDDEETWLQEYCCQFMSDAQNYIPIELISTCVHEEATTEWPVAPVFSPAARVGTPALQPRDPELYLGVDIGRKRDFTIAWLFERVGGILWSRLLLTMKGVTFDEQEKTIFRLLDLGVRRAGIDASGLGMMLAEHAVQKYGAVVEPMTFTAQLKERLAPLVKQAFEERTVRIPDNREVRADINSVKRFVTSAGNVRFDAEHTDRGHADRFWALAQVINAATGSAAPSDAFEDVGSLVGAPVLAGFRDLVL